LSISNVNVSYRMGNSPGLGTTVNFNAQLDKGVSSSFPPSDRFAWKRIGAPTQAMLAKAAQRPAPPMSDTADAVPAPAPPSAEAKQAAAEVVKTNTNNLVFVSGKEGTGSGFIANIGGTSFLVTNAHVAAGIDDANFKTLNGTAVERGMADVASGQDVFRMAVPKGGAAFEVMEGVDRNARVGDEVVVLGNAEGHGVINPMMGRVVSVGPNLVEIDAPFVRGNSGSPIVHLMTGKVIGVAAYAITRTYDTTTTGKTKGPAVRRFGYRLDSLKTWEPVDWQAFRVQAAAMERVLTFTAALDDFFRDLSQNNGRVTMARHTHPVIRTRIGQWQASRSQNLSVADRANADANFIAFLKTACQADLADVQRTLTYDYFQRLFAGEQATRNAMAKAFADIIENIWE
jgi:hypothetical protein